jgi:hypothetical protein
MQYKGKPPTNHGRRIFSFERWIFCDRPKDFVLLRLGRLYVGDRPLGRHHIYGIAREGLSSSRPPQVGFDPRQNAADVHFYVAGGLAETPVGHKSNVVRIPKAQIEEALKSARGHAASGRSLSSKAIRLLNPWKF